MKRKRKDETFHVIFHFMYELVHTLILILRARKVVATTS